MDDAENWYGPQTATFGDRVTAAREAADMTQAELARRLGVRLKTLRAWEDDMGEPRANRLSMLAGMLNVSMMWLINGQGEGIDQPVEGDALPASAKDILGELKELRADLLARADHVGQLERKIRLVITEEMANGNA